MDKENVYLHNKELHSREKNDILDFVGKWMELENILNEVAQTQKDNYHISGF